MASLVHRSLLTWAAASSLVLTGLVAGIAGAAQSTAAANAPCPHVAQPTAQGRTPVLFVHGINSDAAVWTSGTVSGTTDSPLEYVTGTLGAEVTGYTFDWSSYSGEHAGSTLAWVTGPPDPGPGQLLSMAITCLATGSGHKVVVIAHSMGGLLTEDASTIGKTAGDIAAVFTLDTPFEGSWLASSAVGQEPAPGLQIPAQAISAFCTLGSGQTAKQHTKQPGVIDKAAEPVCQLISERDNPGMIGMREEKTTTQDGWWSLNWPGKFPVIRLASDIQGTWQAAWPVGSQLSVSEVGDGVVSVPSQLFGGNGTEPTVTCQIALNGPLGPVGFVAELAASPCFHTKAPYNKTLLDTIISVIQVKGMVPTPSTAQGLTAPCRSAALSGALRAANVPLLLPENWVVQDYACQNGYALAELGGIGYPVDAIFKQQGASWTFVYVLGEFNSCATEQNGSIIHGCKGGPSQALLQSLIHQANPSSS
jgi:hypothetical protein